MTTLTATAWGLNLGNDDGVWRNDANCSPVVAEWFWLTGTHGRGGHKLTADNKAALALCDSCRVLAACLADELRHPTAHPHIAAGRLWP